MDNSKKITNAMSFYLLTATLKDKIRSGWDDEHWNISKERRESVAEHVYGVCNLAIAMDSEFEFDIDLLKVLKMLIVHELGEIIIGDITPFDNVSPEEKRKIEQDAVAKVAGNLLRKDEIISLWLEFEERSSNEAVFAFLCDKLEADLQAKIYQDMGYQNPLDEQENNVVFKSKKVKQIIADGAETAFDVWYEYDQSIYGENLAFFAMLDYAKEHNLKELLGNCKGD